LGEGGKVISDQWSVISNQKTAKAAGSVGFENFTVSAPDGIFSNVENEWKNSEVCREKAQNAQNKDPLRAFLSHGAMMPQGHLLEPS
jgi:hypothetical protein